MNLAQAGGQQIVAIVGRIRIDITYLVGKMPADRANQCYIDRSRARQLPLQGSVIGTSRACLDGWFDRVSCYQISTRNGGGNDDAGRRDVDGSIANYAGIQL